MHEGIDEAAADFNAAWLTAGLRLDGHGYDGIVQHNHWSGKNCPALIRAEPGRWERFLEQVARFEEIQTRTRLDGRITTLEQRVAALEAAVAAATPAEPVAGAGREA